MKEGHVSLWEDVFLASRRFFFWTKTLSVLEQEGVLRWNWTFISCISVLEGAERNTCASILIGCWPIRLGGVFYCEEAMGVRGSGRIVGGRCGWPCRFFFPTKNSWVLLQSPVYKLGYYWLRCSD